MRNVEVLVVANRTAASKELIEALQRRVAISAARFTLLVPATPRGLAWATDMNSGEHDARLRARAAAGAMQAAGLPLARVAIGDPDPVAATSDELAERTYGELIVSTLPRHMSRWLHVSLPQRLRRISDVPVTHVIAAATGWPEAPAKAADPLALGGPVAHL